MPFVLPRSREGRIRREETREKKAKRRRVSELTAVFVSLPMAVDRLLFHLACEYFKRCPDLSDIDSVTWLLFPTARSPLFARQ